MGNTIIKNIEHVKELWDRLDPRDRDIIIRHAKFVVDTLADWRALQRQDQENLVKWFYP